MLLKWIRKLNYNINKLSIYMNWKKYTKQVIDEKKKYELQVSYQQWPYIPACIETAATEIM